MQRVYAIERAMKAMWCERENTGERNNTSEKDFTITMCNLFHPEIGVEKLDTHLERGKWKIGRIRGTEDDITRLLTNIQEWGERTQGGYRTNQWT